MGTKSFAFLAALCCTVLSGIAGISQSVEIGDSAELARAGRRDNNRDINLGLATTGQMLVDGNTAVFTVSEPGQRRDLTGDGDMNDERVIHVFDATSGGVRNLGLNTDGFTPFLEGRVLAFCAEEGPVDLNGDGDVADSVLHVYDTERRSLTNLRLAGCGFGLTVGRRLAFGVIEDFEGRDLNQDGDAEDLVLHIFDMVTGRIQNTRLAFSSSLATRQTVLLLDDRRIAVAADVAGSFNRRLHLVDTATGRVSDLGLRISDFDPDGFRDGFKVGGGEALVPVPSDVDLNGDGNFANDKVLHRIDLASGRVQNTGIVIADALSAGAFGPADPATFSAQEGLAVFSISEVSRGKDLNGDGDISDSVLHKMSTRTGQLQSLKVSGRVILSESVPGRGVVFMSEEENGKDLNGDGDIGGAPEFGEPEFVLGLIDLRGSEPRLVNTRLAISLFPTNFDDIGGFFFDTNAFQIRGDLVSFVVPERLQGNRDLNGDGDTVDAVLHIADLSTLTTRNTALSGAFAFRHVQAPTLPANDGRAAVSVRESRQGRDLNRDGDLEDMVLQTLDVRSGRARNTGLAIATAIPLPFVAFPLPLLIRGETFVSVLVPEGSVDLNSDGDRADNVLHILDLATGKLTNVGLAAGTATDATRLDMSDPSFRFAGLCPGFSFIGRFFGQFDGPACAGPGIGDAYTFLVSEAAQGNVDLNGDGDTDDFVVHATRLTDRDRNGRFDFAEDSARRAGE